MSEIPASHRDLLDAEVAVLATIASDGRPQQTAVWFLADGEKVRISLAGSRQKLKNLRASPFVGLMILDLVNPLRYLELRGDAEIVADADRAFAHRVGAKYGADLDKYDQPGEQRYVVTIHPVRVNAVDMSG